MALRTAIVGGSGYGAAELLRILLAHPEARVEAVLSRGEAGKPVVSLHRQLRGLTDLDFAPTEPGSLDPALDAVFLSMPHGEARKLAPAIAERCPRAVLIDLSQDHRTDPAWVYGIAEWSRDRLRDARRVANPGCFATGMLLAILPALAGGLIPRTLIVDAKTGSSGSGAEAKAGTHHPTRVSTFTAYKVFEHQHEAEVEMAMRGVLASVSGAAPEAVAPPPLAFCPQSAPLVRGIFSSVYLVYEKPVSLAALASAYRAAYAGSPFVRLVDEPPNVADVRGTNNADLHLAARGNVLLALSTVDNLVKGMAGQAVQNLNLARGLPEDAGLKLAGLRP